MDQDAAAAAEAGFGPTQIVLSKKQRLHVYVEPLRQTDQKRFPFDFDKTFVVNPRRSFDFSMERSVPYAKRWPLKDNPRLHQMLSNNYWKPLVDAHNRLEIKRRFQMVLGDHVEPSLSPAFHKVRKIEGGGLDVLMPLNRGRHFGLLHHALADDTLLIHKKPRVVWRGATTGRFDLGGLPSRFYIYKDWERWSNNAVFDFGFGDVTGNAPNYEKAFEGDLSTCVKPKLSVGQQLECKYLLSLEGNDVASGLKWMLASNSLVIMPRPTIMSWACENYLVPGMHFVEVKPDLSDLEDVVEWCEENPRTCQEIIDNARAFMRPFADPHSERELVDEVVKRYHRRIKLFDPNKPQNAAADAAGPDA